MKILLIGDTQIANHKAMGGPMEGGLNLRCREILEALDYQIGYARQHFGIEAIIQVGDFFDLARPSAALYTAVIKLIKRHPVEWHILAGNHDIASYDAPTAISPLKYLANVHVYEKPTAVVIGDVLWSMVPYTGPSCEDAIRAAREELGQRSPRFCVCHYGLVNNATVPRTDLFQLSYDKVAPSGPFQSWFFGHEHGSLARKIREWRSYRSLGSFCDYDFGSGCEILHHSLVVDTQAADITCCTPFWTPIPMFADLTTAPNDLYFDDGVFCRLEYASALYARVRPEHAERADFFRKAGMLRDFAVLPADAIAVPHAAATQEESSYMECVAGELVNNNLEPEQLAAVWELCDQFMQEASS
jgi:hypothetical protein